MSDLAKQLNQRISNHRCERYLPHLRYVEGGSRRCIAYIGWSG